MAVATACAAPRRTRDASARAPAARPRASRMIDLPAPVSPVSAVRPGPKARSRLSISTMSRMAKPISMAARMNENPPGSKTQDAVDEVVLLRRLRLGRRRLLGRVGLGGVRLARIGGSRAGLGGVRLGGVRLGDHRRGGRVHGRWRNGRRGLT